MTDDAVKKYAKQLVASIEKAKPFANSRVSQVNVEKDGTLSVSVQVQPVLPVSHISGRFVLTTLRQRMAMCTGEQTVEFRITPKLVTGGVRIDDKDKISADEVVRAVIDHYREVPK